MVAVGNNSSRCCYVQRLHRLVFLLVLSALLPQLRHAAAESDSNWPEGYFAICAVVKDQGKDLRYWLEYHKWIGTQRFYIFDNNSTRPLAPLITDYLRSGTVEYTYFAGKPRKGMWFSTTNQAYAYNQCIQRYSYRHRFIAFIDIDEFIVFNDKSITDVNAMLRGYEMYGGLALNWVMFGSSGHQSRPRGGPLINYTKCLPLLHNDTTHVKVIGNTKYVQSMAETPHEVVLAPRSPPLVLPNLSPVFGPFSPSATWDKVVLHHYVTGSKEDFARKIVRGSGASNHKQWSFFEAIEGAANDSCMRGVEVGRQFMTYRSNTLGLAVD